MAYFKSAFCFPIAQQTNTLYLLRRGIQVSVFAEKLSVLSDGSRTRKNKFTHPLEAIHFDRLGKSCANCAESYQNVRLHCSGIWYTVVNLNKLPVIRDVGGREVEEVGGDLHFTPFKSVLLFLPPYPTPPGLVHFLTFQGATEKRPDL